MNAYIVCDPDSGCVVKLADTASKARWAGCLEIGGMPGDDFEAITRLSVRRIPDYDGDDEVVVYRQYWRDHNQETGDRIVTDTEDGGQ